MAQQIGELFVSLGVKGTDKTVAAFTSIKGGLSDVRAMSLETKAAIVGAMYALEQMTSGAGHNAQGLVNLNNTLGIGIDTLQRYRYAASLAGASNQEMDASFQSIQKTMAEMRATGQTPQTLAPISTALRQMGLGAIDPERVKKQDWAYLFQKYNQFAQSNVAQDQKMRDLQGVGLSPGVIAGMMGNKFTPHNLASAPIDSNATVQALDKMQQTMTRIQAKFNQIRDSMVVKWGPSVAKDLEDLLPHIKNLIDAFGNLNKAADGLKWVGKMFEGWASLADAGSFAINAASGDKKARQTIKDNAKALVGPLTDPKYWDSMVNPDYFNSYSVPGPNSPVMTLNQNFYGPATPSVVKKASEDGVSSAYKKQQNKATNHFSKTNSGLKRP